MAEISTIAISNTKTPILDFSANINPLGLPEQVKQAVTNSLDVCAHYPDPYCRELTAALSNHYDICREHIICGNGAADLITRFTLAQKPKNALLLAPTFSGYEHALNLVDCHMTYLNLQAETDFSLTTELFYSEMLSTLTPNLDVLFLCNPNNPTGQVISTSVLKEILNTCKQHGITLFLDECFLPFVTDNSTQSLLPDVQHIPIYFYCELLQNNMPWQDFVLVLAYVPTKSYYNKCSIAVSLGVYPYLHSMRGLRHYNVMIIGHKV